MKKIFIKIFLFIISLYLSTAFYIEYFPLYYNSANNTRWFYFKQVFDKKIKIKKSKTLFLGDSRLNTNLDLKKIPDSWSFAAGGSSPIEMNYALKKYVDNYWTPDTIFVSFSPRTLIEAYSFWDLAVRNKYLNFNDFNEIMRISENFPNDKVLGDFAKIKYLLYKFNFISYYQSDIYNNHLFLAKSKNEKLIEHFQTERGIWNYPNLKSGCSDLNYETGLDSFVASAILNHYLNNIFTLCKNRNITVIFDFMPMNKSSYINLNQNFVIGYKSYMQKLAIEYPTFIISDTLYYYEDKYFGDDSHLNESGKQILTAHILQKYFKSD